MPYRRTAGPGAGARRGILDISMASIELRRRIKAKPEAVWKVISDLSGLALMAPHISKIEILEGEGRGLRRRVYDHHGRPWVETCTDWREGERYTMTVDDGEPLRVYRHMDYTWGLTTQGEHVTITMRFEYAPRYGIAGRLLDRLRYRQRLEERHERVLDAWVNAVHSRDWARKLTVETILDGKGREVIDTPPDARVAELAALLREKRIGCVVVRDGEGGVAGIVSERDSVVGLAEDGPSILGRSVAEIMTRDVVVCRPEDDMMQIMSLMTERRIRHLPVVVDGRVAGLVSIGDVVKARIAELESESESLREYIAAGQWRDAYRRVGPAAGGYV
jgi:CBS domain-containing protein